MRLHTATTTFDSISRHAGINSASSRQEIQPPLEGYSRWQVKTAAIPKGNIQPGKRG